jgi:glycosyltransferase involved in cell wall biosynthesis
MGMLRGNVDLVSWRLISGWAQDTSSPEEPVGLIVTDNDQPMMRMPADRYREDLEQAAIGSGRHSFEIEFPRPLSPSTRHVIRVCREFDGMELTGSPVTLEPLQAAGAQSKTADELRGNIDLVGWRLISGWVQDTTRPDEPVSLVVTDNDQLVARILANRYREDLEQAAIGGGRHAFELTFPRPLPPLERHVIRIFRELDAAEMPGSPATLEPARTFGAAEKEYVAWLLGQIEDESEIAHTIDFFSERLDSLKQQLADRHGMRAERRNKEHELRRWRQSGASDDTAARIAASPDGAPHLQRRALVIDDRTPKADRDAGSNAVLAHMQSLQRLGYEVTFAAASEPTPDASAVGLLEAMGMRCARPPIYGSVEDVLRRQAHTFDLVYLHRISNASKYLALARHYFPKARVIYSVADLHHIRYARQAAAEDRPELTALSNRVRLLECVAAAMADAVITHSRFEADVLRKEVRGVNVHIVPWSIATKPVGTPFARRRGLAFIGGFGHAPNQDAARWLIGEIMPLVRKQSPDIECLLVGSEMPEALLRLCGNGVVAVGHVDDLAEIFERVRLTVAPLSFGAGIKGKVIESLAAGLPCACTPIAAEGLDLPEHLRDCVGENAAAIAAIIRRLHDQKKANESCRKAALDYVAANFSAAQVDELLRPALGIS